MIRTNVEDKYFNKQPDFEFFNDLKVNGALKIDFKSDFKENEIKIDKINIARNDFEGEKLLKTVFDDFKNFIYENAINGDRVAVNIIKELSFDEKTFIISVSDNCITVKAKNIDLIRRAVIRLEDLIVMNNGGLLKGEIKESIELDDLISRCFFSPINRPPKNIEELASNEDFYPDGYLNKLMHDGITAIWITSEYSSLIKSSYITEFGQDSERRIAKLNQMIEKCALYGIKVFLFLIEPISLMNDSITRKFPDLYKKYPQVMGNSSAGPTAFCTYTEFGEKYLKEAVKLLFTSAPDLGGIISITQGERVTSCATTYRDGKGEWSNNCPHCKDKSQSEIVAHTVKIIVDAMKEVSPKAKFISWTYGHRGRPLSVIKEYVEKISDDAIMMQNFEDDGRVKQLGKKRFALDYFLCYVGPSEMFAFTAENAIRNNKTLYAKMQICSSHELATMPFIPVPGIIFDKIKKAKRLNVKGIMESWFFGNYPCIMSKAVELLSTNSRFNSKYEFIKYITKLYFKKDDVSNAVKGFNLFEKAYKQYPVNVMFNYYGPMHDGIVWEYALKPKNFSLPRTWKLEDAVDGDRIGECLFSGHTIKEAIILCQRLVDSWEKGCKIINKIKEKNEIIEVADGLNILFHSGLNALKFYDLRDKLGYGESDAGLCLEQMRKIVLDEIENSEKMIDLCRQNKTFGYHSEAEGYKFFPEKLQDRIEKLNLLLSTEFVEIETRIINHKAPLNYYLGEEDGIKRYHSGKTLQESEWEKLDDNKSMFKVAVDEKYVDMEFCSTEKVDFFVCNEFRLMFPQSTYIFTYDGKIVLHRESWSHQSVLDEKVSKAISAWKIETVKSDYATHIKVRGKKRDIGFIKLPYKLLVKTNKLGFWCKDPTPIRTLGKTECSPADFGWIL